MAKSMTLEQRCTGGDIVDIVKSLRMAPPGQTDTELKKLLKSLGKPTCPPALLMWAALCGSREMKQVVAKNEGIDQSIRDALMMDAEMAPWYVFDILEGKDRFSDFMLDIYGADSPYSDASNLADLIYETASSDQEGKWKPQIPEQGSCDVLQAELVRIIWRFARTLNYCVAYDIKYDDQMFIVLHSALDRVTDISPFSRNLLKAFLRWSQMQQRSRDGSPPSSGYERYDPVSVVVDVILRSQVDPIPFDSHSIYKVR